MELITDVVCKLSRPQRLNLSTAYLYMHGSDLIKELNDQKAIFEHKTTFTDIGYMINLMLRTSNGLDAFACSN